MGTCKEPSQVNLYFDRHQVVFCRVIRCGCETFSPSDCPYSVIVYKVFWNGVCLEAHKSFEPHHDLYDVAKMHMSLIL